LLRCCDELVGRNSENFVVRKGISETKDDGGGVIQTS
jgi:hypothetical protein